jgi:hypothetical protein
MTGLSFSDVLMEIATRQWVSMRRDIRLQGEQGGMGKYRRAGGGARAPSPSGSRFKQDEEGWVVVAMEEAQVFDVGHLLIQGLQFYSIAGDTVVLLTVGKEGVGVKRGQGGGVEER